MGKQTRSKKSGSPSSSYCLGKGKVTPRQIAFIVDRYLCDNSFSETRSVFRNEASSFIPISPPQEAPRNLLTLEAILEEYICLKEQKVMVEEERARLDFEKTRVHNLLHSMQGVLNAYNSTTPSAPVPPSVPVAASSFVPGSQLMPCTSSPPGGPAHVSPGILPVSTPSNACLKQVIVSTPISAGPSTRKRAGSSAVYQALPENKRSRSKSSLKQMPSNVTSNQQDGLAKVATAHSSVNGPLFQVSSVAKSLFNQPLLAPPSGLVVPPATGSTAPNTPPQIVPAQEEKSVSPRTMASGANSCSNSITPQDVTPTNCTVFTSERVTVSPCKNPGYYTVERNKCIATSSPVKTTITRFSKRDCVKSRLDFDGSDVTGGLPAHKPSNEDASTSESDKDSDPFDIDFPNLDMFGPDFCFSELLVDLDLGADVGFNCQQNLPASVDTASGSSPGCSDENPDTENVTSEFSSTVTRVMSEKDAIVQGADNLTAMRSVTKCIILSPAMFPI